MYFILDEDNNGSITPQNIVLVEDGYLPGSGQATTEQIAEAETALLAGWDRDPVELYLDFKLGAQNAAHTDGDYVECVLKAATAAEVLIKHTSRLLSWEVDNHLPKEPSPNAAAVPDLLTKSPGELIGSVLAQRLRGNWTTQLATNPAGAWRHHIARRRNAVIHRGYRPTGHDASESVSALLTFEGHLLDRLATVADTYPRTAIILAGKKALDQRGAWGKVRATSAHGDRRVWVHEYTSWLDETDTACEDEAL